MNRIEAKFGHPIVGPSCDLAMFLNGVSFTKPLYLQKFSKNSIHELVGRQKSVHIYLSLQQFANRFHSGDVTVELLPAKELRKFHAKHKGYSSQHQQHVLRIRDLNSGAEGALSDGLLQKMFSDLFLPSELFKVNLVLIRKMMTP